MKKVSNKFLIFLFIFFILLISFRIDYRFKATVECCSDDYDYFIHSSTIALDFDLNYENQNPRAFSYNKNDKNTPIGFIGSGIMSSPFLFFGNLISKMINEDLETNILNYQLLIYSFSSIFYLLLSFILIFKTLTIFNLKINKYLLLYFYCSTGITYFAFERFSMTHVYEVFTISLIMYLTSLFYSNLLKRTYYSSFIPLALLLSFITRMSNYYIFVIPLIVKKLLKNSEIDFNKKILNDKFFLISSFFSTIFFILLSQTLYGEVILNPQKVYGSNINLQTSLINSQNIFTSFISIFRTLFIVLFSSEFGLFWVSPILFVGLICLIFNLRKIRKIEIFLLFLCFGQNILIIHIWQSTASSYGFRYLFSLIPLSILIYFLFGKNNKYLNIYLFNFSSLGFLSVIFFETTLSTQLSLDNQINSFGNSIRYVEPDYVFGLFSSFIELNSYLIIFTTSFLGVSIFKFILFFINIEALNNLLFRLGLPIENSDFQNYIYTVNNLSGYKVAIILFILIYISYLIVYKIPEST